MIAKLLSYPKTLIIIAVLAFIGGGWLFVNGLVKKNAEQAATIQRQETAIGLQAGEIVGLKIDATDARARQDAKDRFTRIKDREWQIKIKTTNNQRGGGLENALLKKGDLTIGIINNSSNDSLREIERATDNPND